MKILITGSKGMLGSELARQLKNEDLVAFDAEDMDVTDPQKVQTAFDMIQPEIVYNCVAYNNVDGAETDQAAAFALNVQAVKTLADNCNRTEAILVHYSTGFVFDGEKDLQTQGGYKEDDQPNPQSIYAKSKYEGEKVVATAKRHYIIRLNLLFGEAAQSPGAKKSFPQQILELAKTRDAFDFVSDEVSTPTYAKDLAAASIHLVNQNLPNGIYHLPNEGVASWYDYAAEVFKIKGLDGIKLNKVSSSEFQRAAKRPKNSVIVNTKLPKQRPWQEALREFLTIQ